MRPARSPRSRPRGDEAAVAKTLRAISFVHDALGDIPERARLPVSSARHRRADRQRAAAAPRRCARSASCTRARATCRRARLLPARASRCASCPPTPSSAARRSTTSASISRTSANSTTHGPRCDEAHDVFAALGLPLQRVRHAQQLGPRARASGRHGGLPSEPCARRSSCRRPPAIATASLTPTSSWASCAWRRGATTRRDCWLRLCARRMRAAPAEAHAVRGARGAGAICARADAAMHPGRARTLPPLPRTRA